MESKLRHVYVTLPAESARRMWRNYAIRECGHEPMDCKVDFVPAQGGCFVVTSHLPLREWISRPLDRLTLGASDKVLSRFKDYAEKATLRQSTNPGRMPTFIRLPHQS